MYWDGNRKKENVLQISVNSEKMKLNSNYGTEIL